MMNQFTKLSLGHHHKSNRLTGLTDREIEICQLVAEGMNNKEISEKLFLGEGTVKNHITKILQKLDLRDRTQLAIYVLKS